MDYYHIQTKHNIPTNLKDGDILLTRPFYSPVTATRKVTFENNGVRINQHWFTWHSFFSVNFLIEE